MFSNFLLLLHSDILIQLLRSSAVTYTSYSCILVDSSSMPLISYAVMTLKVHKSRITDLCWSPFDPNLILSVGYDGKAMVSVT